MTHGRVDTSKGRHRKLTAKQQRFVEEFLVDLNAAAAARRAGYANKTIAAQLLASPHVSAAIGEHLAKRAERTRLTADEIVASLRREANDREANDGRTRVKALEVMAKIGGFISDTHLHKHFNAYEERERLTQEQVLDALPLETRRELLDTVKKLQAKRLGVTPAQSGDVIELSAPEIQHAEPEGDHAEPAAEEPPDDQHRPDFAGAEPDPL